MALMLTSASTNLTLAGASAPITLASAGAAVAFDCALVALDLRVLSVAVVDVDGSPVYDIDAVLADGSGADLLDQDSQPLIDGPLSIVTAGITPSLLAGVSLAFTLGEP